MTVRNDDICHLCAGLLDIQQHKIPENSISINIKHHGTFGDLIAAGDKCAFCHFLSKNTMLGLLQTRFPELNKQDQNEKLELWWHVKEPTVLGPHISWVLLELCLYAKHLRFIQPSHFTISTCTLTEPSASSSIWKTQGTLSPEEKCSALRTWMEECSAGHEDCQPAQFQLPTRLIEVGSSSSSSPRLVLTDQLEHDHVSYAALSHCWGSGLPLKTTSTTVQDFMEGIPVSKLPKTFRDAIAITRSLDIPYLWIDALCIIQDNPDDWASEAGRMYEVYAGSVLTIAAASGSHSEHGCFPRPDDHMMQQQCFQLAGSESRAGLVIKAQRGDVREFLHSSALSSRGWTLQEQILPGRVAHFTDSELHWDCRRLYRTEQGLQFCKSQSELGSDVSGVTGSENSSDRGFERIWSFLMEKFSRRQFTIPSDRLPALAGIVKHFTIITGNHHLLACWKETIISDLVWCQPDSFPHGDDKGRYTDEVPLLPSIPSWSWISRCHRPAFDIWLRTANDESPHVNVRNETKLVESCVVWTGAPLVSTLIEAHLTLDGPIAMVKLAVAQEAMDYSPPYLNVGDEVVSFEGNPIPWTCAGNFDRPDERHMVRTEYPCLLLRSDVSMPEYQSQRFLILEHVRSTGGVDTYRRIGLFHSRGLRPEFIGATRNRIRLV